MMMKKEVLDKVGNFDEEFFMYGEDVDLSYRILKTECEATVTNYKNYYFADSNIIHFKGESTKKGSMNYVRMFYNAMSIFVRKHYGGSRAGIFNFSIHLAIWFRAALSAIGNFIRNIGLPLIDAGLILFSFWAMKTIWNQYVRTDIHYENKLLWIAFPAYTLFYLIASYYAGLYDRWYKRSELVSSTLVATTLLLAAYSLLPEQYRFSRAILVLGSLLAFVLISILRRVLIKTNVLSSNKEKEEESTIIIAGSIKEYEHVLGLLHEAGLGKKILGRIAVEENDQSAIGYWKNIKSINQTLPVKEIIYCEGVLSFSNIIESIQQLPAGIGIKIHANGSNSIVSSNSKDSSGEALSKENGYKLADPYNRRLKRLIDVCFSFFALISFPIHLFFIKKPFRFLSNCFSVLVAKKTWVGYAAGEKHLPKLYKAVLACNGVPASVKQQLPEESLRMVDYWYARDYEPGKDLKLIVKLYRRLGE
jgi:hypothetical protein